MDGDTQQWTLCGSWVTALIPKTSLAGSTPARTNGVLLTGFPTTYLGAFPAIVKRRTSRMCETFNPLLVTHVLVPRRDGQHSCVWVAPE